MPHELYYVELTVCEELFHRAVVHLENVDIIDIASARDVSSVNGDEAGFNFAECLKRFFGSGSIFVVAFLSRKDTSLESLVSSFFIWLQKLNAMSSSLNLIM